MGVFAAALALPTAAAQADDDTFELYGDFRLRLEADWDSRRADGSERDDRNRMRVRARVGLDWRPIEQLTFGLRLRSGSDESQQSPHITVIDFDDNDTGDVQMNFDKWFVRGDRGKIWGWAGRNSLPFWKQNEFVWDDDVTPAGIAGGLVRPIGDRGKLTVNAGYFSLPSGMQEFSGNLGLGQIVYGNDGEKVDFTVAGGLLRIEANPADADAALLRNGNGLRDYSIFVLSGQCKVDVGERPMTFGIDYLDNDESYAPSDAYGFANRDESDGHVVSIQWGSTGNKGDWLLGYFYARIGAVAVHASYAEDDWVRWGSPTQTDGSDLEGHELRFGYGLGRIGNILARLYFVEDAGGSDGIIPPGSSRQDGKRFRLDYNVSF